MIEPLLMMTVDFYNVTAKERARAFCDSLLIKLLRQGYMFYYMNGTYSVANYI